MDLGNGSGLSAADILAASGEVVGMLEIMAEVETT